MLVREMKMDDIAQAVEIEKQCFSHPWSEKSFIDSIQREDTIFLACVNQKEFSSSQEEQISGYIGMYVSFDEANITNVAVLPEHRGCGMGQSLVEEAKKQAVKNSVERIFLEVRVSNVPAIRLYEKMGFENLGVRKNFYDQPKEDAYIMCCSLL